MASFRLVNGKYVIDKHPQSELDYGVRMYRWLVPGDSLDVSRPPVWAHSAGVVIIASGTKDSLQTAFALVGGGDLGELEWASCTWWTVQGRKEIQTLWFNMVLGEPVVT